MSAESQQDFMHRLVRGTNLWIEYDAPYYHVNYLSPTPGTVVNIYITSCDERLEAFVRGFKAALTQVNGVSFKTKEEK